MRRRVLYGTTMTIKKLFILCLALPLCLLSCKKGGEDEPQQQQDIPAFPGAEGGGMYTKGGRGGEIYYVNSLEDKTTPGTLRYVLNQPGAKTVVFSVSGTIYLTRALEIKEGAVTIAGQTAPGDGICIAGSPVLVKADDVIIRFLRFRMGDINKEEADALSVNDCNRVIIDHCSFSWSTDECVSCYGNSDFTLQYSFITESLRNSIHDKGRHGYGGIWGGKNATFHHNLLAHHDSRNPRFDHDFVDTKFAGPIDYVNNVIYNWGGNSAYGGEGSTNAGGGRHINMVNNYYKYGPATSKKSRIVNPTTKCDNIKDGKHEGCIPSYGGEIDPGKFYIVGNYVYGSATVTSDNWQGVDPDDPSKKEQCRASSRWTDGLTALTKEQSAEEAYETVLSKAGCSLHRDAVDARIVEEVREGKYTYTGSNGSKKGLIDTQSDVGGWPDLKSAEAPTDTDDDGMPDEWESAHGLDPIKYSDSKEKSLDKNYTNLEVYLNSLVADLY